MKFGPVDYASAPPPRDYKCAKCGVHGCKLWREYQTFADYTDLYCCDCAAKDQKKDVSTIDASGRYDSNSEHGAGTRTDQIGWLVPAVPTEEGNTYWGYTSVPEPAVKWWIGLPTRVRSGVA